MSLIFIFILYRTDGHLYYANDDIKKKLSSIICEVPFAPSIFRINGEIGLVVSDIKGATFIYLLSILVGDMCRSAAPPQGVRGRFFG